MRGGCRGVSLIREEQGGLSQVESTKTSAELNLVCGGKSPSWLLLHLALGTISAPPGFHLRHNPSVRPHVGRRMEAGIKTDTTWPLPGTPLWGKSQGHQDFLAKTWASAWTQLERQEPKRVAFPDPETSDSLGPRKLPSGGCPQPTSCPTRWSQISSRCKQPVPPKAEGKGGGGSRLQGEAGTGPGALTPGIGCL